MEGEPSSEVATDAAGRRARHQLGRVLLLLAALDIGVIITVVVLAVLATAFRLTNLELIGLILGGLGAIVAARVAMAVRLRRRSGSL